MEKASESKYVYKGRVVNLRLDTVANDKGKESTVEVIEHADCIAVVAVDEKDNVLMEKQFRRAIGRELFEIPAGGIEPGETIEETVRREMQEETGLLPLKVEKLGGFYSAPGYCTEYLHVFVGMDLVPGKLLAEDTEEIKVERVPVKDVPSLLEWGEIQDAKSIAALCMYMDWRKRNVRQ
jgi:ADP-ribose pyrophosphatase